MIADVNMYFISMYSTLYKHLLLMQTRYVHGKLFIKLLLNGNQIPYSFTTVEHTASYMTAYVTHKLGCLNVFREDLHFISQFVCLEFLLLRRTQQLCDGLYYGVPYKTCNFESLGENIGNHSLCFHTKEAFQN
jgi:hypothetical protein